MKIYDTEQNHHDIKKKMDLERAIKRNNDGYRKERKRINSNDFFRLDKDSEGYCYVCSTRDLVAHTVLYICNVCYLKRGKEGVMANVIEKRTEYLCDTCGWWRQGDDCVWQRNVGACHKCLGRVQRIRDWHAKQGYITPYQKFLRKKYGNEVNYLGANN